MPDPMPFAIPAHGHELIARMIAGAAAKQDYEAAALIAGSARAARDALEFLHRESAEYLTRDERRAYEQDWQLRELDERLDAIIPVFESTPPTAQMDAAVLSEAFTLARMYSQLAKAGANVDHAREWFKEYDLPFPS